jgi:hypothetical protein
LRRWYYRYELRLREPPSLAASYSTWLIHKPMEAWVSYGQDRAVDWEASYEDWWQGLRMELGLEPDFEDVLYNLPNARKALALYVQNPIPGKVLAVEERSEPMRLPNGQTYISIPDFLIDNERGLSTVDFKMTSRFKQPPLSPFDDQFLGQAITFGATGFYRVTFMGDKKNGKISMLEPEWQPVDSILAAEWLRETDAWATQIETARASGVWPKDGEACHAFGKECPHVGRCELGLKATDRRPQDGGGASLIGEKGKDS